MSGGPAAVSAELPPTVKKVVDFWFGKLDGYKPADDERKKLWFMSTPEQDSRIKSDFGDDVEAALDGDKAGLRRHGSLGDLAFVILTDQLTRNVFRGSKRAFDGDKFALHVALAYFDDREMHERAKKDLFVWQRVFLYMPLMHAEDVSVLNKSVAAIEELRKECVEAAEAGVSDADLAAKVCTDFGTFAEKHRAIVESYGRYPHRNEVLGRESTPEELKFLVNGDRFGQ